MKTLLSIFVTSAIVSGCQGRASEVAPEVPEAVEGKTEYSGNSNPGEASQPEVSQTQDAAPPSEVLSIDTPTDEVLSEPVVNLPPSAENIPTPAPIPAPIATPRIVAGPNLKCSVLDKATGRLNCTAQVNEVITELSPTEAFLKSDLSTTWVRTSFTRTSPGLYQLDIPSAMTASFAVGLVHGNAAMAVGIAGRSLTSLKNLVADGDFEEVKVTDQVYHYSVFAPAALRSWKVKQTPFSGCAANDTVPLMELQETGTPNILPFAGSQWTDLDAACALNQGGGGNVAIFQTLALTKGHVYHLSFAQRRHGADPIANLQRLVVSLDAEVLIDRKTTDTADWVVIEKVFVAKGTSANFQLEDRGAANSVGTLVDDVKILNLGPADAVFAKVP